MSKPQMKILGLCGSLRDNSANAQLLRLAKVELGQHEWLSFDISKLPYFDSDNQYSAQTPEIVLEVRALAAQAHVIFICTPEYAHGIPGILKNAFEWIFHEGTQKKPVFVVIGSAQGENTRAQLIEVFSTMDFIINAEQTLLLKGVRSLLNQEGSFKDKTTQMVFSKFCRAIEVM